MGEACFEELFISDLFYFSDALREGLLPSSFDK